jgi:hypothetical protein
MSAFGTKKPFGDAGVQLTFPLNFQRAYDLPFAYYQDVYEAPMDILVGTDFQSNYHEEKRQYANKTVMDGLQARRTAERKLLTGVHNYHLPKPVLGQRKFANPSMGAVGFTSARRDGSVDAPFRTVESGMTGGVVTTQEGQQFYKKQLADRINQLNRMNALAQGFAVEMGQDVKTFNNEDIGSEDKVQFFVLFDELLASLSAGEYSRVDFAKLRTILRLLFKFAPSATDGDLNDIIQRLEDILDPLRRQLPDIYLNPEDVDPERRTPIALVSLAYLEKMFEYVRTMARDVYGSTPNRKALSKALIKKLFSKLMDGSLSSVLRELAKQNPIYRDAVEDMDAVWGDDGEDGNDGRFDRPAVNREDGEQEGVPRAPLAGRNDDPNRQRFGQRNGLIVFGGPSWFGEAEARDEQADMVAPLAESGFDPNAEGDIFPTPDPITLKEAVEDEVKIVLEPLGFVEGSESTIEDILEANYGGDTSRFVKEVVDGLTEKGFTPAQIAKGMEQLEMPAFGEYVAENTGPTGPARAEPARRFAASSAVVAPSGDDRSARFFESGFPRTREELRADYKSYDELYRLGASIPAEFGGPYLPRRSTAAKNIVGRLIQIVRENVDPSY